MVGIQIITLIKRSNRIKQTSVERRREKSVEAAAAAALWETAQVPRQETKWLDSLHFPELFHIKLLGTRRKCVF